MKKRGMPGIALLLIFITLTVLLAGCGKADNAKAQQSDVSGIASVSDLAGKKVGVLTGSVNETNAKRYIPGCQLEYFNSVTDLATAVSSGRVDAVVDDEVLMNLVLKDYTDLTVFTRLCDCIYGSVFPKTADGEALCAKMNEFIAKLRADGTLQEIEELWFDGEASAQTVDFSGLTGENGTINMAISTAVGAPFSYVKDGQFAGYELDIAARFCREYGYSLKIEDYIFSGLLVAVSAGKCDFGACGITATEERAESVLFSDPTYLGGNVVVVRRDSIVHTDEPEVNIAAQYAGKRIGVNTGAIFDQIAMAHIPDCHLEYINATPDIALALDQGKIDAYVLDEPIARLLVKTHTNQYIAAHLQDASYGFIFQKNSAQSDALRAQVDEFLAKINKDGTRAEIDDIWFGEDESLKTVDYESLTGENGTLSLAVSTDIGAPFVYRKGDGFVGYEMDILTRFCREYGYALKVYDYNFAGMLAAVSAGKCNLGASCIEINAERAESMDFSSPDYAGGVVLVTSELIERDALVESDPAIFEQLRGYRIGVNTGTLCDVISERLIPDCQIMPFNANADLALALETGKIDAYMTDEPIARLLISQYPSQHLFGVATLDKYGYIFPKDSQKGDLLCAQMNSFLARIKANGTLGKIDKMWFGSDKTIQTVDYDNLIGVNGTLSFAVSSGVGAPFCYVSDGEYVGYDVDIAVRFCQEYGYDIDLLDSNFSGMLANVTAGKCDFGASCITISDERSESVDFSDSDYDGGVVVVVKNDALAADSGGILSSVKESFERTFLRENRWKLFAGGIGVTVLITVLSAIFGTLLGFLVYLLYRKSYRLPNMIVNALSDLLSKTPVVVILMILYYIVFGKTTLDGIWVSVIGFSLIFACAVMGLLKVAVRAVDSGQMEAALALGYSDTRAFIRVVLPQALQHFLPGYQSEIVTLIKGTAIVGYIAVQDLTKISDVIRSRTYEAFFPLIASAIFYFALAWALTLLVRRIRVAVNPKHRTTEEILKGVQTK